MLALLAGLAMMNGTYDSNWDYTVSFTFRAFKTGVVIGNRELGEDKEGWLVGVDESGAWYWQARSGETTHEYRPTAKRQNVLDGKDHKFAYSFSSPKQEIRLYFDRRQVAVLNVKGWSTVNSRGHFLTQNANVTSLIFQTPAKSDEELADDLGLPQKRDSFTVLAFNIWHAGKEDGEEGFKRLLDTLREADADIICMIETYGSGPEIADEFGYNFFLRSSNLSIHSKFPIGQTFDIFKSFNFGGAEIKISQTQTIRVFDTWLHYLPSTQDDISGDKTVEEILAGEMKTRGTEIKTILESLKPILEQSDEYPVIMAGDFNSGSHLDWTEETKQRYNGYVVPWPVTVQMEKAGFTDAFRTIYPDPLKHFGRTWSPRFKEALQYRIDYVFHHGPRLKPVSAKVFDSHPVQFASDHAAVLVEYEWVY